MNQRFCFFLNQRSCTIFSDSEDGCAIMLCIQVMKGVGDALVPDSEKISSNINELEVHFDPAKYVLNVTTIHILSYVYRPCMVISQQSALLT